jgi:DMSO/TMAO reductase YedYZ heme-binding membrane subunit
VNSQVWWFVARSSGIIAWALLTLSVVWGLLLSTKVSATRIAARKLRPAWILDLHRHLGGLAVIFTAIHLIGIAADSYVTFGWADIFVPMASEWKPGAVAFGVVSLYLLLAIEATSLAIRRLPRTAWRWVHRTSFVLYATATYHGILAGTDAGNQWFRVASWISIAVVVVLTARLLVVLRRKSVSDRRRHETPEAAVEPLPEPLPTPMVLPMPSPTLVPMPSPRPTSMPSPAPSMAPLAMPLVAAIPPLPGTVTELAAPLGSVTVQRSSAPTEPPAAVPLPTLGPPTMTPSPPPPPPPPPPPHRALAEVSSGGRGGDDLGPPPGTT